MYKLIILILATESVNGMFTNVIAKESAFCFKSFISLSLFIYSKCKIRLISDILKFFIR